VQVPGFCVFSILKKRVELNHLSGDDRGGGGVDADGADRKGGVELAVDAGADGPPGRGEPENINELAHVAVALLEADDVVHRHEVHDGVGG